MLSCTPNVTLGDQGTQGAAGVLEYRWGADDAPAIASPRYLDHRVIIISVAESFGQHLAQQAATITKFRVVLFNAMATDSLTITLRKNGVDTALIAVVTAGAVNVVSTGSVSVVAGDLLSCRVDQSGTEVNAVLGLRAVAS